jgi:hypothetical protein
MLATMHVMIMYKDSSWSYDMMGGEQPTLSPSLDDLKIQVTDFLRKCPCGQPAAAGCKLCLECAQMFTEEMTAIGPCSTCGLKHCACGQPIDDDGDLCSNCKQMLDTEEEEE